MRFTCTFIMIVEEKKNRSIIKLTLHGKIIGEMVNNGEIDSTTGEKWYTPYLTNKSVYTKAIKDYSITNTQKFANKLDKIFKDNEDEYNNLAYNAYESYESN